MEENHDITTFLKDLFSLDNDQYCIQAAGWTGVTGDDILCGWGLDIPSITKLDRLIIKAQIKNHSTLDQWHMAYSLEKCSFCFWKRKALIVVGNNPLKRGVITLFHDSPTAGHSEIAKTIMAISENYWWPGIKMDVTEYIKGCATCQMTKTNMNPNKLAISPITPKPNALPFQTVTMDLITDLPTSNGYDTILMITDHNCSKAAFFLPCNKTIDAEGIAWLYTTNIIPHYGISKKIISDRDPQFIA